MKCQTAASAGPWSRVGGMLLFITIWLSPIGWAQPADPQPITNSVNELQNQDLVFALLTEAYASVQRSRVVADYESRLKAAQLLADEPTRKRVAQLAEMERFLREQQLVRKLEYLGTAYDSARRLDEERLGVTITANVDARAVNRHLDALLPTRQRAPDELILNDGRPMAFEKSLSRLLQTAPPPVQAEAPAPPGFLELLTSIRGTSDQLVGAVTETLRQPDAMNADHAGEPALVIITYRKSGDTIRDTVVQTFEQKPETRVVTQNWQAAHPRAANLPLADTFDKWIALLGQADGHSYGSPVLIQQRERLLKSLRQKDLRYLREQIVEPLYTVVLLPNPGCLLPRSLRNRVAGIMMEADLASPEWTYAVRLLTADADAAEQVSQQLVAWQLLAQSSAPIVIHNRILSDALEAITVEVSGKVVFSRGGVPAKIGWHGADWLMAMLLRAGL